MAKFITQAKTIMKVAKDHTTTITIYACPYWNDTGIEIAAGEQYEFSAKGKWKDLFFPSDADGYTLWYMQLFKNLKRSKENDFFVLMGSLDKENIFRIGSGKTINFNSPGILSCFANDVKYFYWNNRVPSTSL
jgi:hypothetical protein